jgi:hypothetical protein
MNDSPDYDMPVATIVMSVALLALTVGFCIGVLVEWATT